jgi:hypothetical protein
MQRVWVGGVIGEYPAIERFGFGKPACLMQGDRLG